MDKQKAPRNRTLTVSEEEKEQLSKHLISKDDIINGKSFIEHTINGDTMEILPLLPDEFANLIIIDPPYNLTKNFSW